VASVSGGLDPRVLDRTVEGCAASHQMLLALADSITPQQLTEPSMLPGWTRAHVLWHLALNARSHIHLLECAARGERGEQYPGGVEAREAAIAEGADKSGDEIVSALRMAIFSLEGAWAHASHDAWTGTGVNTGGAVLSMYDLPFLRWREVVVHLTDLNIGLGYDQWPDLYVRMELDRQKMMWAASHPMGLTQLPALAMRLPDKQRLAWLLRRETVDGLPEAPGL